MHENSVTEFFWIKVKAFELKVVEISLEFLSVTDLLFTSLQVQAPEFDFAKLEEFDEDMSVTAFSLE